MRAKFCVYRLIEAIILTPQHPILYCGSVNTNYGQTARKWLQRLWWGIWWAKQKDQNRSVRLVPPHLFLLATLTVSTGQYHRQEVLMLFMLFVYHVEMLSSKTVNCNTYSWEVWLYLWNTAIAYLSFMGPCSLQPFNHSLVAKCISVVDMVSSNARSNLAIVCWITSCCQQDTSLATCEV